MADHPKQSPAFKKLFEKAVAGKIKLVTLPIVIVEIVWVPSSFYKESTRQVADKLRIILSFKGLEIPHKEALLLATGISESEKIDFIDAYTASWLKTEKLKRIYSYYEDFDKVEGIIRKEP